MAPLCACHSEPMQANGSRWRCRIKQRERQRRYLLTDKGRARARGFRVRETARRREARIRRLDKEMNPSLNTD